MRPSLIVTAVVLSACASLGCDTSKGAAEDTVAQSDCPVFTAEGRLPSTVEEAKAAKDKGATYSNRDIRARYICWVGQIGPANDAWKAQGLSAEERSKRAFQMRHDARLVARAMMASDAEVKALEARDQAKYGSPSGPTYDWLVNHAKEKGLTGDAVFEEIVTSAQRTNEATNASLGL